MYWVYENWRARGHKAVIHLGKCRHCKNGQGLTTGTRPDNGRWQGPFRTPSKAWLKAERTGGKIKSHSCVTNDMQRKLSKMSLKYKPD